jgi:hypothetical protein
MDQSYDYRKTMLFNNDIVSILKKNMTGKYNFFIIKKKIEDEFIKFKYYVSKLSFNSISKIIGIYIIKNVF